MELGVLELQDDELFQFVAKATEDGITLVRALEAQKKYLGNHFSYPLLRYEENGFPSFSESLFDGPIDYGYAFGKHDSSRINYANISSFNALIQYTKNHEHLLKHFGPPDSDRVLDIPLFEIVVVLLTTTLIERYLYIYKDQDFSSDLLKSIYIPIERSIFEENLEVDIYVPILLVGFDVEHIEDEGICITRMTDKFQIARTYERRLSLDVHRIVADAATHAVVFPGCQIENNNYWKVVDSLGNILSYPIRRIDAFFASLRAVTGLETGYAQILAQFNKWTHRYITDLPSVKGVTTRAYPNFFDNGYWLNKIPVVTEQQAKDICTLYLKMINCENNRIFIATRRLNACFSRDNEEDSILDATIALETLFADDERQEMTHKLAMRVAAISKLTEDMTYTPLEYFQMVKHIYAYRSAIVHGSANSTKKREINLAGTKHKTVDLAVELLRRTIIVLLDNQNYLNPVKIDEELLLGCSINELSNPTAIKQ